MEKSLPENDHSKKRRRGLNNYKKVDNETRIKLLQMVP